MLHRPSVFVFISLLHLKVGFAVMRNLRIGGFEKSRVGGKNRNAEFEAKKQV